MDSSNSQQSYSSLYIQYINSTPNIYGLRFRSKKPSAQNQPVHTDSEMQENCKNSSIIKTQPTETKQSASCSEPTVISDKCAELDTDINLSAIFFQPGNETICEKQKQRAKLSQHEISRLLSALKIHGSKAHIAQELRLPSNIIHFQAQILFNQIQNTKVSKSEWAELILALNLNQLNPFSYYHSVQLNEENILDTFKAAFKVTRNQDFSAQFCARKFGVNLQLVNTLVRQAVY
ncbi:Hypothetical_protein [Hexamita inflata]|uniref:Hypothetical_protein n=1 Tax=Hexamita inflata TaxID=28002 RepID=A0AA86UN26_9EUKA|nr:Hypothetical protein HINF_LOCUS52455 [Hexamita inflata]